MLKFGGYLNRKEFVWAFALRFGLYLASIVGLPSLWIAAVKPLGCSGTLDSASTWVLVCYGITFAGAMWFKPLALSLFAFSCVGITLRRARDAGAPAWVGLMVPLLFVADHDFFNYFWVPWTPVSSRVFGIMFPPSFALLGLGCVAVLCALPPFGESPDRRSPFGRVGLIALGLGLPIALSALLRALYGLSFAQQFVRPIASLLSPALRLIPYTMITLSAALLWITWQAFQRARWRNKPQTP